MNTVSLRRWFVVHKWTSLVCTLFLLTAYVTGLPILFSEQIWDAFIANDPSYEVFPPSTPNASLDAIVTRARALYRSQIFTDVDPDDEPAVLVSMAPSWQAVRDEEEHPERHASHWIKFDAQGAKVVKQSPPAEKPREWVEIVLDTAMTLHMNLFAGLPGALFMGAMGVLFFVSMFSGAILYSRFMRRLPLGSVRRNRAARLTWLDLHNLLGAVTLVWALMVGFTGFVNALPTPLFGLWRITDVRQILKPYAALPVVSQEHLSSVQAAFDTAARVVQGNVVTSLSFLGSEFGSPVHYLLWTHGATPLRGRLFTPILVDARTGELIGAYLMPWYLRFLEISRPLHFGDYGGMPLKLLWALLDLVVISGVVLWAGKRRIGTDARLRALGFDLDAERVSASSPCSVAEGR